MSLGLILVWLHISLMFMAVLSSYGPTLLFLLALRSNRTENLRAVGVAVQPVVRFIPVFYGLGAVAGVSAALVFGVSLLAPWLVISYVLFVALTAFGAVLAGPRLARVGAITLEAPDGPLPAEIRTAATSGGFVWLELLDFAGLIAVIFVMVVKPFS